MSAFLALLIVVPPCVVRAASTVFEDVAQVDPSGFTHNGRFPILKAEHVNGRFFPRSAASAPTTP
ncbi:hypothetical protein ACIO3O_02935 [Streptomyces sp. NPDC087440]|uniref:hypothetical protein n=1 Tax=Streptomyces sp. NPDC087440 TaxID=3365790 RepID=UPI00382466BE